MAGPILNEEDPSFAQVPKWDWTSRLVPPLVGIAAFAAFLPALRNQFVDDDDWLNFVVNPHYRGLGWTQVKWMFGASSHLGHYIPLTWLTFGLDYVLWGMNPAGYHLTSLVLHAANAVVFYFVSRRLLTAARPEQARGSEARLSLAAAFSAGFFALHPLRVESVAWATERRDVLAALFYLLAVLCYLKSVARENARRELRWRPAVVVLYTLSLLSKISGITLPLVLLVLDVYPLRRLPGDPKRWLARDYRPIWLEKIPFLIAAVPAAGMALVAESQFGTMRTLADVGFAGRVALSAFSPVFYLWKTLAPTRLALLYELPLPFDPFQPRYFLSGALLAGLSVFFYRARRRFPAGLAVWSAYLTTLIPMLGIVTIGRQVAADRNTYLSCLGWAVLAGGALLSLRRHARAWFAAAACVLLALAVMSWRQTLVWRDSMTLWRHVLAVRPDTPQAHYSLGTHLSEEGKYAEAAEHFSAALRLRSDYSEARNNLGLALVQLRRIDEAVSQYDRALRSDPANASVHSNLGLALAAEGRGAEAIEHYRRALEISPGFGGARVNLANALFAAGRPAEAIAQYRTALSLEPDLATARNNLGYVLATQRRFEEAVAEFRRALEIRPDYADADDNLGMALASQGKFDEAIRSFNEALRLTPGDSKARRNLSVVAAMRAAQGNRASQDR